MTLLIGEGHKPLKPFQCLSSPPIFSQSQSVPGVQSPQPNTLSPRVAAMETGCYSRYTQISAQCSQSTRCIRSPELCSRYIKQTGQQCGTTMTTARNTVPDSM